MQRRNWIVLIPAILLLTAFSLYQVYRMLVGEADVLISEATLSDPTARKEMLSGLMQYFQGFGAALVLSGIAYIMIGYEEDISTNPGALKK